MTFFKKNEEQNHWVFFTPQENNLAKKHYLLYIMPSCIPTYALMYGAIAPSNSSIKDNVSDVEFLKISHDCNLFKAENMFHANYINLVCGQLLAGQLLTKEETGADSCSPGHLPIEGFSK